MFKKNFLRIPEGIRLISWATAVRFTGWGFVEMFLPVFLISFAHSYAETGLLRSVYDISFLIALPVISRLADRISSKKIIISGLVLYPLIALSYFFAGLYGAVILVVIARLINGLSYALDNVGKKTYMRRYAAGHIGLIFGYFDTVSNFWWLVAATVGLFLIRYIPLYWLFLLIIPTTLAAILIISLIPHERKEKAGAKRSFVNEVVTDYRQLFTFIKNWTFSQKYITLLYAFLGVITVVVTFFIPLVFFETSHSYTLVFLLTAFATLPYIFGIPLGLVADRAGTNILLGIIFTGVGLLALLPFIKVLSLLLFTVFVISLCAYYAMLVLERCATLHESRSHMGSLSGAFLSVFQLAQVVAPIGIGILIDRTSLQFAMLTLFIVGIFAIIPLFGRRVDIFKIVG